MTIKLFFLALIVIGVFIFFIVPLIMVFSSKECRKLIKEDLDGTADKRRKEAQEQKEKEEAEERKKAALQKKFEEMNATYDSPYNKKLLIAPRAMRGNSIDASRLVEAFNSNEFAAEERFYSKRLVVTGEIQSITRNVFGQALVKLVKQTAYDALDCYVDEHLLYIMPQLKIGQDVYVDGIVIGKQTENGTSSYSVNMIQCAIYKSY